MAELLADKVLERKIENFVLVPSDGGRFEFSVNDTLIYSKLKTRRHAEQGEIARLLEEHIRNS